MLAGHLLETLSQILIIILNTSKFFKIFQWYGRVFQICGPQTLLQSYFIPFGLSRLSAYLSPVSLRHIYNSYCSWSLDLGGVLLLKFQCIELLTFKLIFTFLVFSNKSSQDQVIITNQESKSIYFRFDITVHQHKRRVIKI